MSARWEPRGLGRWSKASGVRSLVLACACSVFGGCGGGAEALGRTEQRISSDVVIGEFFAGGGNTGSSFQNDFVVLFNRGAADASIDGWSLQYASAAGTFWSVANLDAVTLHPGQHWLVQLAGGTAGGALPTTPDQTSTAIDMAVKGGKLALVRTTTKITASTDADVVDFVGWGTADQFETAAAPATDATTAGVRANGGCTDTDDNSTDFAASGAPSIDGSSSTATPCGSVPADAGPPVDTGGPDSAAAIDGGDGGGKPADAGPDAPGSDARPAGPDLSPASACTSAAGGSSRGGTTPFVAAFALALAGARWRRRR